LLPDPELAADAPDVVPEPDPDPKPDDPELPPLDVVPELDPEPELPAPSAEEQAARNAIKANVKLREWLGTDTFFSRKTGADVRAA
jgi:hypothetical protein